MQTRSASTCQGRWIFAFTQKDGGVVQIFGASKIAAPYNAVCSNFVVGHSVYDVPFAIF